MFPYSNAANSSFFLDVFVYITSSIAGMRLVLITEVSSPRGFSSFRKLFLLSSVMLDFSSPLGLTNEYVDISVSPLFMASDFRMSSYCLSALFLACVTSANIAFDSILLYPYILATSSTTSSAIAMSSL